jgi:lipopolysaccharide biosynthesis glycosyltransferase
MKAGFTTVLDDRYVYSFLLTLNSLIESSNNFNYDVIIFEWGELSMENKKKIKQFYPNTTFKEINSELYKNFKYDDTFRKWEYNCNYRFDIFTLKEYDKIVFFDSDIIFQLSAEELLLLNVDFGATKAELNKIFQVKNQKNTFDAGILIIGKKYLNENTRMDLLDVANSLAPEIFFLKSRKWVSDEPILNTYFIDKVTHIPQKFNLIVSEIKNENFKQKNNYHFAGHRKPWNSNVKEEQFDTGTLWKISKNNNPYMVNVILTKLLNIVKKETKKLQKKNIYL